MKSELLIESSTLECGYCGMVLPEKGTKEHIIPKCFKVGPYDLPWPTIIVCKSCNTKKSVLDDKVRDLLVADIASESHPMARELLSTKSFRSFSRARKRKHKHVFDDLFQSVARSEIVFDASGIAHHTLQVEVDQEMVRSWFRFIVSGLSLKYYNQQITGEIEVDFVRFPPGKAGISLKFLKDLGVSSFICPGPNTECACVNLLELPINGKFWYFRFFKGIEFFVGVEGGVDGIRRLRGLSEPVE